MRLVEHRFGAARGNDRQAADQLLNEAERAADRLGDDRNDFWFAFGPTNVRIHAVSLAVRAPSFWEFGWLVT